MLEATISVGDRQKRETFQPSWLGAVYHASSRWHRLTPVLRNIGAIAGIAVTAGIAPGIAGSASLMPSLGLISLAVIVTTIVAVARVRPGAEAWLDVLGRAFDAAPVAQLIVGQDGQAVQGNIAFARLFAGAAEASLDTIEHAAANPEAAALFRSLREEAEGGAAVSGTLALQLACRGRLRHFEISVEPGGGHSQYDLWTIREIGVAAPSSGSVVTEPCGTVGELLDKASIKFPSLDETGCGEPGLQAGHGVVPCSVPAPRMRDSIDRQPSLDHQRLFADAPIGIGLIDRLGRFIAGNRALGKLLDVPEEALVGRDLIDLLSPEDGPAITATLASVAAEFRKSEPVEVRLGARTVLLLLKSFGGARRSRAVALSAGCSVLDDRFGQGVQESVRRGVYRLFHGHH